jgi:replicative DNA helicase
MTANAERMFISAVLRQEDHKTPVLAGCNEKWFTTFDQEWSWIYRYIERHRKCPSKALFKSKFPEFTIIKSDDVDYCLRELKELYIRRTLVSCTDDIIDKIVDENYKDSIELVEELQGKLIALQADVDGVTNESDVLDDWELTYSEVSRRLERAERYGQSGIPTGFGTLDLATNGPQAGDYWIVAARLGQGKTWALLRMACTAVYQGFTVQYDALEQSRSQIAMRAHSFLSSENAKDSFHSADLMRGQNFDLLKYKTFLKNLREELKGKLIVNDTSRGRVTPSTIAAQIERNKPDVVFIDYITLMSSQAGDWQAIAALSAELKGIAMRYEVPIVAAAQINRTSLGNPNDMPGAEHLSGSDGIGQDADLVMTMKQMSRSVIKMRLAKYRHGMDGQEWFTEFKPNSGVFVEISGDDAQDLIDEDRVKQ